MVYTELFRFFKNFQIDQQAEILTGERMAPYTSFRIGGNADILISPRTMEAMSATLGYLVSHDIPYRVIGRASNLLIDDDGFRGVLLRTTEMNDLSLDKNVLTASCGATLARVAKMTMEAGLSGFERLSGIPGTVGGALCMNAGAYGSSISEIFDSALVYDTKNCIKQQMTAEDMHFAYRSSVIDDHRFVLLEAKFLLLPRAREDIAHEMNELAEKRRTSQPLELPSAGSVFKRPPNDYAGRLIEAAGLKGARIGDAEVSKKHAGFIVNVGNAKAQDVRALIELVQLRVRETSDVLLSPEIDMIP